jgi:hypothetical protein
MASWRIAVALVLTTFLMMQPRTLSSLAAPAPRVVDLFAKEMDHATGIVLVGWREGSEPDQATDLLAGGEVQGAPGRARMVRAIWGIGVQVVQVEPGLEGAWLAYLRSDPRVAYAELDHRVTIAARLPDPATPEGSAGGDGPIIPNDPAWPSQWSLATLRMAEAWQSGAGSPDVVIAVVDTGLALSHPDLADKLWTNAGEIAGNGLDDDENGKVDDVHGWRFYHYYSGGAYTAAEDATIVDDHGHGTHVAGTAAATTNNGIGIAGVSWGARIMAVKVLDQYGTGWYSDVAAGVAYAADNGARVINLSLGDDEPSLALCAAVQYAHDQGSLVVAATGNSGGAVFCPATCPHALAVAASDSADGRASFSNYGPEVDVTAPGSGIYSTWPWLDGYATRSGTSMAAAHVSGVASLVWSLWPALGPERVAVQLMCTAVDIEDIGVDPYTGNGRIDALAAMGALCDEPRIRLFLPLLVSRQVAPEVEPTPTSDAPTPAMEARR